VFNPNTTGGWQTYQTFSQPVQLTAGTHVIKVLAHSDGFNLNWLNFSTANAPVEKFKIKNRWKGTYLYDAGDRVRYGVAATDSTYLWVVDNASDYVEIKNLGTGDYMNIEGNTNYVKCTPRDASWWSARWNIIPTTTDFVNIKSFWQTSSLVHVENQQDQAQCSAIDPAWESTMWRFLPEIPVKALAISPSELSIPLDRSFQFTYQVSPLDASNKSVQWKSTNTSVATVDSNGIVKTLKVGSAYIIATSIDNKSLSDTSSLTVTPLSKDIMELIDLQKGWNLVSFNLVPADSSLAVLFGNTLSKVQEIKDLQSFYSATTPFYVNSLTKLLPGKGYLVKMAAADTMVVTGTEMPIGNLSLKKGWNMVDCPFQTKTGFEAGLAQRGIVNTANLGAIKNFDGFWVPSGTTNSIDSFEPGKGYFILQK
jgi:hypothetical protein